MVLGNHCTGRGGGLVYLVCLVCPVYLVCPVGLARAIRQTG
jgi:hypothetical protein